MALWYILVCLAATGNAVFGNKVYLGSTPLENPDLFGGDILGIEDPSDRSAIVDEKKLWPGARIPYVIDGLIKAVFYGAFMHYRMGTCVEFVPRTNETDYIRFFKGEGCYSHVGRTGGVQPVSIGEGCYYLGTVIHELGHAIGFYHEQNRSDRDEYLTIYWDNIKDGLEDQFFKLSPEQNRLLTEFDYDSIMLYGEYTFSKDKKRLKTMAAKKNNQPLKDVITKNSLSKTDKKRINMLYKCDQIKKAEKGNEIKEFYKIQNITSV